MSELATTNGHGAEIIEQVLAAGDLARLSHEQRTSYYLKVCESLGLNPLTQPFQYITLNSRLVLYARKDATDQLRALRRVSLTITARETMGDLYVVTARAQLPDGRTDEEIGAVPIAGLKGELLANAYMKASTKAKRRVTLSICGLGLLDESEIESIPEARVEEPTPIGRTGRTRLEQSEAAIPTTLDPEMTEKWRAVAAMNPGNAERLAEDDAGGVPGDDVDALEGQDLYDACQRLRRRLNATGVAHPAMPAARAENNLRVWWHHCAGLLGARN